MLKNASARTRVLHLHIVPINEKNANIKCYLSFVCCLTWASGKACFLLVLTLEARRLEPVNRRRIDAQEP